MAASQSRSYVASRIVANGNLVGFIHGDKQERDPRLPPAITRVLAVERLRKVNALVGFTRIDDMDRVGNLPQRLVPLTRTPQPTWTVATEDRGEGIVLQLDDIKAEWSIGFESARRWVFEPGIIPQIPLTLPC